MQAVKLADVFVIEKVWASIYEANRQHGDSISKASEPDIRCNRKFYTLICGIKRFVRRWWVEHDNPEFGHRIISGIMHRMHEVAKRHGMSICDYYTVG